MNSEKTLGVIIVTFNSSNVIIECLHSLFATEYPNLKVVVVDNNSLDNTVDTIVRWANDTSTFIPNSQSPLPFVPLSRSSVDFEQRGLQEPSAPRCSLTIVQTGVNGGFGYAVNRGLEILHAQENMNFFWILNPDCVVPPDTPKKMLAWTDHGPFALLGLRQRFYEHPEVIQSDGCTINRHTGVCRSLNSGLTIDKATRPEISKLDFISGASMLASRQFVDEAGFMREDFFLYYEEVEWAFRRGKLPLLFAYDTSVFHHGGTSIGTGVFGRRASAFANYFNSRNRMRFVREHFPKNRFIAKCYTLFAALKLFLLSSREEALALARGAFELPPPKKVSSRIKCDKARAFAFGKTP